MVKGIRGATVVEADEPQAIYEATKILLEEIIGANQLEIDNIITINFTATQDLKSAYPAKAAREMGLNHIPLMCTQEMFVEDSLPRCIRVLILVNCFENQDIQHIYLKEAKSLRPDLGDYKRM